MEKLIDLVYYYNSHLKKGQIGIGLTTSVKENGREVTFDKEKEIRKYENYIISKKYGFIERLVENDKIDLEKYKDKSELYTLKVVHGTDYYIDLLTNKVNSDFLLMILSIQDNPIEYLCSILKEE